MVCICYDTLHLVEQNTFTALIESLRAGSHGAFWFNASVFGLRPGKCKFESQNNHFGKLLYFKLDFPSVLSIYV